MPRLPYSCGDVPFDQALLLGPALFELDTHPAARALREFATGEGPDIGMLRDRPWRLVRRDDRRASYIAEAKGDPPFVYVTLENGPDGWTVDGWGSCRPELAIAGLNTAVWWFDPSEAKPGPDTRSFTALVTEMACASGRPTGDRVRPPLIAYEADRVLVAFTAQPQGGNQDCQGHPPTPFEVELREPLGDRILLDAAFLPPRDPSEPWP